ncbi:MAG: hypothetical protein R3F30_14320 [Planctomycetota bacterium]
MRAHFLLAALLPVCAANAQELREVDHVLHLQTPGQTAGVLVIARPPFASQKLFGLDLAFDLKDVVAVLPFATDAGGAFQLPYPKGIRLHAVLQAFWAKGAALEASNGLLLRRNLYAGWANGPSNDPKHWPIGVWLQQPRNATRFKALGVNLYVGLHNGPTTDQLTDLKNAGIPAIAYQTSTSLLSTWASVMQGWTQMDEPDNAQWNESKQTYDPPVLPSVIVGRYDAMRKTDPTRPVYLNVGAGVADEKWVGRGTRTGHLEDYPEYAKGCDIFAFDYYPVANPTRSEYQGKLELVGIGVRRMVGWCKEKPAWNWIEAGGVNNGIRPTPDQIRTEVWMSIVCGASSTMYFCHEFTPKFDDAVPLSDPKIGAALTAINGRLAGLAEVLNGPAVQGEVSVSAPVEIAFLHKVFGGKHWLFAVNMTGKSASASFTFTSRAKATVTVLDEARSLELAGGKLTDSFAAYATHLYELGPEKP